MAKPDISPTERKLLEELQAGFPALVRDMQEAGKVVQAFQQKVAAHVSMLQAYGWPIPEVEGLVIQSAPLPPAIQAALSQAIHAQSASPVAVVQPASIAPPAPVKAERGTVRKYVNEVLQDGELTVLELRDQIQRRYGVRLGLSSIYRILLDKTRYLNNASKWRLKK